MTVELDPLSAAVQQALEVERARPEPSLAQLERLTARLDADFSAPAAPPSPASSPAATSSGLAGSLGAKALLVSAGLAVGGITGAQLQARYGTPREVVIERRIEVPVEVRVEVPVREEPPAPLPARPPAPPPVQPRAQETAPTAIEMERLLIERATAALARGNGQQALAACTQHAQQFPKSQLAEERESLAIRALVLLGRRDEARARAENFRQRFPDGLLLDMVNSALDGTTEPVKE